MSSKCYFLLIILLISCLGGGCYRSRAKCERKSTQPALLLNDLWLIFSPFFFSTSLATHMINHVSFNTQVVIDAFRMISSPGGMMGMSLQPTDPRQTTSNIGELLRKHCNNNMKRIVITFFFCVNPDWLTDWLTRVLKEAHHPSEDSRPGPLLLLSRHRLAQERFGGTNSAESQQKGLDSWPVSEGKRLPSTLSSLFFIFSIVYLFVLHLL